MTSDTTTPWPPQSEIETAEHLFDNWFDSLEAGLAIEFANSCKPCWKPSSTKRSRARATPAASRRATTNTRRVRRALSALFAGAVGKDTR